MKIVISNSKVVLKSAKTWTMIPFEYVTTSSISGVITPQTGELPEWARSGSSTYVSTDELGKSVLPVIPSSSDILVFAYDSSKEYLGYGTLSSVANGAVINDIIDAVDEYLISSTAQTKADVVAAAKYFRLAFSKFADNTGYGFKVR